MPSNGKELTDWLRNHFPAARLSNPQWEYWARDLAREEWDTAEATTALSRLVQAKPGYLPTLPEIQAAITAHHRRRDDAKAEKPWQEDPPTQAEAAACVEQVQAAASGVFGQLNDPIKYPGWDSRDFCRLAMWRRQHDDPAPVGPTQRAARERLSAAILEEERVVYRAINAAARARR